MESRLGFALLLRTTRQVKVTAAGEALLRETRHILGDIESSLRRLRETFENAPKEVRVGVSKTVGLAYLPGFFSASQRKFPEVGIKVRHEPSGFILSALEAGDLDAGVVCLPEILPDWVEVTHRFSDAFTLIAPAKMLVPPKIKNLWQGWLNGQNWLLIDEQSHTGAKLRRWISAQGGRVKVTGETDNFDLIINLVGLGLGVSLVPQRALASYPRKRVIRQIPLPARFSRELVVLVRRSVRPAPHLERFVETFCSKQRKLLDLNNFCAQMSGHA